MSDVNKKDKIMRIIRQWIYIILGCFLDAIAANLFFDKIQLVTGGITGISIIIKYFTEIPLWISNLFLNVPLFLIAVIIKGKSKGKELGLKTLAGIAIYTFFLGITTWDFTITDNILLVAIFGAVITGIGVGLNFRAYASTGGTDLIAIIIHHFFPGASMGKLLNVIESCIVICGAFIFGIEKALYALIAVFVYGQVVDIVLNGAKNGNVVYIISDKYNEIAKALFTSVDRGITGLKAEGMYKHQDKEVLMLVADKKQVPKIKHTVYDIDNNAFLFVTDTSEVLGNGFLKKDEIL